MYLRYFGLNEAPFSITPDPAFVYLSPRHRDALAHLLYGIGKGGSGGFVQLTGEVGTGKTTICRYMLEQVPEGTHVALILNPMISPLELLAAISEELGIETGGNRSSARLLVDGLNHYLLKAHARGEQVVVVIDEAQNLSQEALEQVRLLTNLETSKEKLLQIVLLGQPELRDLLHRRSLRQLAQRITARYHLNPLGRADTGLYVDHRLRIAGAERNPFRPGAVKALYQRSQGIPRLINIIADRALLSAFSRERAEVTGSMIHEAADEVQLGERQIKRQRWPWLAAALAVLVLEVIAIGFFHNDPDTLEKRSGNGDVAAAVTSSQEQVGNRTVQRPVTEVPLEQAPEPVHEPGGPEIFEPETELGSTDQPLRQIDRVWLQNHQGAVWQGMAGEWRDDENAMAVQSACDGNESLGYACLRDQGNWAKIRNLGLPVILVLQGELQSYLLLRGMDGERLLVGASGEQLTISRQAAEEHWLGAYLVVWPQAEAWPAIVMRGDTGLAVTTIMEMAARDEVPYHGGQVFDATFERWLRNFQMRNGLNPDGIVGRKTLLHLMRSSIEEPRLLTNWED